MSIFPEPVRTVKPRKPDVSWLPVIAVSQESGAVLVERTGRVFPICDLPELLLGEPTSLVVTHDAARLVHELTAVFDPESGTRPHEDWQFRVTPVKRTFHRGHDPMQLQTTTLNTVVGFFGFAPPMNMDTGKRMKRRGRYFYPVDPFQFAKRGVNELVSDEVALTGISKLLAWGVDVREWCGEHELRIAATPGGIAAQLLRDTRFYPTARRKVPRATNDRARFALPGNHYRLYGETFTEYNGTYIDMKSAHHHCASVVQFPHADTLMARGRFHVTETTFTTALTTDPWAKIGSPTYQRIMESHGLLLVHLTAHKIGKGVHPHPALETPGHRLAWLYTNELPLIAEQGGIVDGIEAAWVSWQTDPGLNHYASWAMTETALSAADRKRWLKPLLLATYGLLAAKPRIMEFGYAQAIGGITKEYPAGNGTLTVKAKQGEKLLEMNTTNVIHRGMIEAECRMQTIRLAATLTAHKLEVLQLYADSVIVASGPLPLLPAPWIVKGTLTNLVFFDSTSFIADELVKLPGVPERDTRAFIARRRQQITKPGSDGGLRLLLFGHRHR